ncbi:MAG: flagellar basal body P-ring formation protein FlgA [Magnetospirillum gryphiswaldense]|nr:flagellar basal body P-ring formation protein FlgA [Magnetospirillum gryphiswaldense]
MKRFIATLVLLAAAVPAWAAGLPVTLKATANIQGDVVKLGDLWENLGDKAEVVLAGAPQPGKRIIADARWLSAVAQANAIDWQPASAFDRIVIERAGQLVDMRLVEAELRDALTLEGMAGAFDIEISNRSALNVMVPAGSANIVNVRDVALDIRNNRFSATVEVDGAAAAAIRQRVNGRVFPVTRVPVLSRGLSRGDIINEADIKWVDMRADLSRRDILVDLDQIVGQEPRMQLRPDAPLRASDLRRPVLVERNAMVTVSLKTANMSLTSQAKAQDAGGKGDIIRILNMQSKRTVEAVVEGPGLVSVSPGGPRLLSN